MILTALVQNVKDSDMRTRLAATRAMLNALEFAHANFSRENERDYIMQASGPGGAMPGCKGGAGSCWAAAGLAAALPFLSLSSSASLPLPHPPHLPAGRCCARAA